jgi:hypothetical protein
VLSYNKTVHLPGFVTKKVKISRDAEVLTFDTEDKIKTLYALFGWMSIYGVRGPRPKLSETEGRRITATHTMNVVDVLNVRFPGQQVVLCYDHHSLRVEVAYMKVQLRYSASGSIADTGNHQLNLALNFFRELPVVPVVGTTLENSSDDEQDESSSVCSIKVGDLFSHGNSLFSIDAINISTREITALVRQPRANRGLIRTFSLDDRIVTTAVANFAR